MIEDVIDEAEQHMKKSVEALRRSLSRLRTGRAHPSLLEQVPVNCYGSRTPLRQLARIGLVDARTLIVSPWDGTLIPAIEKALRHSSLGINPAVTGDTIHVPLPPLTEERRRELIKVARTEAEQGRVAVRNARRDAMRDLRELKGEKLISEDDERRGEEQVQKLTDRHVQEIETISSGKEKELTEV